jgi:phosphatidylglycerol:prolipoprotein diacylglycerol transferase
MLYEFYQHLPQMISPVAFTVGSLAVRWYSLMYLMGFGAVWGLLQWRINRGETNGKFQISKKNTNQKNQKEEAEFKLQLKNTVLDFLLAGFVGGLLGGRLGYALFYQPSYFWVHPFQLFSPFNQVTGFFEGFYGMSYHGALVGGLLGAWTFAKLKKLDFLSWADFVVPALPAGYFFGRVGNFLNGELVGRITTSKFGMHFASSPQILRYPSQLLEACLEGALLFALLWKLRNQKKFSVGFLLTVYFAGYAMVRFFCEFFRQPDPQLGLLFFGLTMGQILSLVLFCFSLLWLFSKNAKSAIINEQEYDLKKIRGKA